MSAIKYNFHHLPNKKPPGLSSKSIQENLLKWSMKKCLHINYYAFNQEFVPDDIDQFTLDLFRDNNVVETLQSNFSEFVGSNVAKVETKKVSCTATSMTFFDKILDPDNNIVCSGTDKDGNHIIRQCMEVYKNGIYLSNNLKMMLFEDECEEYQLYDKSERNEFLFRLLKHFVTGGRWCQDDVILEPYLNTAKCVYKDLLAVEKTTDSKLQVSSKMYKVVALDSSGTVLFPKINGGSEPCSFTYLAINPKTRTVALFFHNVGDTIYT